MSSPHQINPEIFGMYDIRGTTAEGLTDDLIKQIGRAFGTILRRNNLQSIVVGRDMRLNSLDLQKAFIDALLTTGCKVIDVGQVPTPVLYFSIDRLRTDGGAMITASHNPPEFNGLKLRMSGKPFVAENLQVLRKMIEVGDFVRGVGALEQVADVAHVYIQTIMEKVHLVRKLKVVIDAGNGCAGPVALPLLESLGCEVIAMYIEPDGHFPNHHPDPMKHENLRDLIEKVRQAQADVGIAYDGDSDRLGVVDDKGDVVTPDEYVALLAGEILATQKGAKIVFEVKVSKMLIEEVQKLGGHLVMSKVGYPFMLETMRREQAEIGGELSGHYYFHDAIFHFDDGIYASARFLQFLSRQQKSLSQLRAELPKYIGTQEITPYCPHANKFTVVDEMTAYFRSKGYDIIDIDGVRVSIDDGWGLIRASNTEARLTLRFEAATQEGLDKVKAIFRNKLREYRYVEITF